MNPGASNCNDLDGKALETKGSSVMEATVSDRSRGPTAFAGSFENLGNSRTNWEPNDSHLLDL